jgi:carbon storage regulator
MLVLTRRAGEEIVIAGNIRVMVVAVNGQKVRLGITAPPAVPVARRELLPGCSVGTGVPTAGRNGRSQDRGGAANESGS